MLPAELFHPIAIHFPIVLTILLAAFDLGWASRSPFPDHRGAAAQISTGLALLAGVAALIAFALGDIAYDIAVARGGPADALEIHEGLGSMTAITLAAWALVRGWLWWRGRGLSRRSVAAFATIEAAAMVLVIVTAFYGGRLVYTYGVGVATT
jgi:uncharacterized membrane protein